MAPPNMRFTYEDIKQFILELIGDPEAVRKKQQHEENLSELLQQAQKEFIEHNNAISQGPSK